MHDFREAYLQGTESAILAEAFRLFIKHQIKRNRDIRTRYIAARKRRGKPV
jgi:hypothetical protein